MRTAAMDDYFFNELQSHPIRPEPITDVANGLDSLCVPTLPLP